MQQAPPFMLLLGALVLLGGCGSSRKQGESSDHPPAAADSASSLHLGFENVADGSLPSGWTVTETNAAGALAVWRVETRADAPEGNKVLSLVATENSGSTYNLFLSKSRFPADLDLSVAIHANSGEEDQGGGLVWRAEDHENYQIVRWNPLEDNLRVYKVVHGRRTQLASATLEADPRSWHRLDVQVRGETITIRFDGKPLLRANDDTFRRGGRIGLWTKADAATSFDDLRVSGARD